MKNRNNPNIDPWVNGWTNLDIQRMEQYSVKTRNDTHDGV